MFKTLSSLVVVCLFFSTLCGISGAQETLARLTGTQTDEQAWVVIKGDSVSLYYLPGANLRKIESRLRSRYLPVSPLYRDLLLNSSYPVEQRISARLQLLLIRVKDILGMNPVITDFKVKLFRSRKDLAAELANVGGIQGAYPAFYFHLTHSIYSSEQDVLDSIIAHEMAHAVIDSYFSAIPPPQVAELIASFVDEHLEQD